MSSKFELTQDLLKSVRDRLLEQETQIILAENVTLEGFLKVYLDYIKNEQGLPVKIRLVDNKVIAYEVHLISRGTAVSYVTSLAWSNQLAGACEEDLIVGPNSYFIADGTIRPRHVPRPPSAQACNSSGHAYPTMVVEVGLSQSICNLHELIPIYFSRRTTIMIVLAIKIYPPLQSNAIPMEAMLYLRTS